MLLDMMAIIYIWVHNEYVLSIKFFKTEATGDVTIGLLDILSNGWNKNYW